MIAYVLKGYGTWKISNMKWNSLFKVIHPFSLSVIQIEKNNNRQYSKINQCLFTNILKQLQVEKARQELALK